MLFSSLAWGILAARALASPVGYVLHEKRDGPLNAAIRRSARVDGNAIVPIRIGLVQSNIDKAEGILMEIAHPESQKYGEHLTAEQVNELFAPSEHSVKIVKDWLVTSGVTESHINLMDKGWLAFEVTASKAEELFQAKYYEHETDNGNLRIGCDDYSLPKHVSAHVDYIKPGVTFSPPVTKNVLKRDIGPTFAARFGNPGVPWSPPPPSSPVPFQNSSNGDVKLASADSCASAITPPCIRALYSIPKATGKDNVNVLGIYEAGASFAQADLNTFFSKYATNIPQNTAPIIDKVNGGVAPSSQSQASLEADLDFQIAYSLVYPETLLLYQDGTQGANENSETFLTGFLDYVDGSFCTTAEKNAGYQCGAYQITPVVSISYTQTELALPQAAQVRSCNEIMKLTMQGTTFVIASGDYGVASQPDISSGYNGCYDPSNPNGNTGKVFSPTFPNNCPYVLSVGGTQIPSGGSTSGAEVAMLVQSLSNSNQDIYFSSSGGFANYFSAPSYQSSALSTYFNSHDPGYPTYTYNGKDLFTSGTNIGANGGVYNRAGRGFPDVSANGVNFVAVVGGKDTYTVGTSLAAPIWASIITLINENRTASGKSSVGFVNPTLYANPSAFHDIVSGSNPGCESKGFSAVAGWDPVTGLGTPKFPTLLSIFSALK